MEIWIVSDHEIHQDQSLVSLRSPNFSRRAGMKIKGTPQGWSQFSSIAELDAQLLQAQAARPTRRSNYNRDGDRCSWAVLMFDS